MILMKYKVVVIYNVLTLKTLYSAQRDLPFIYAMILLSTKYIFHIVNQIGECDQHSRISLFILLFKTFAFWSRSDLSVDRFIDLCAQKYRTVCIADILDKGCDHYHWYALTAKFMRSPTRVSTDVCRLFFIFSLPNLNWYPYCTLTI